MNKKSFTVIEILVTIVIVGVISGIVFVSMDNITDSAKDNQRKNDIESLRTAIVSAGMYGFPVESSLCNVGSESTSPCSTLHSALVPKYYKTVAAIPRDPSGEYYTYQATSGTDFTIKTTLSNNYTYQYQYSNGFSEIEPFTYVEFTSSTYWQVPGDVTSINVIVVGAGGGGKGGHNWQYGGSYYGGGGGNNGTTTTQNSISVTPGQTLTITIGNGGTGGAGGTSTCGNGLAGGQSLISGTGVSVSASGGAEQSSDYSGTMNGGPGSNGVMVSGTYATAGSNAYDGDVWHYGGSSRTDVVQVGEGASNQEQGNPGV
jgi:type II secretory pathway pseudopilin PulG